jgi:Galactose oxidase, central domain
MARSWPLGGSNKYGRAYAGADLYDPVRNRWQSIGSLNVARSNHTATLLQGGSVLIAGGYVPSATYLRSAEIFRYPHDP